MELRLLAVQGTDSAGSGMASGRAGGNALPSAQREATRKVLQLAVHYSRPYCTEVSSKSLEMKRQEPAYRCTWWFPSPRPAPRHRNHLDLEEIAACPRVTSFQLNPHLLIPYSGL